MTNVTNLSLGDFLSHSSTSDIQTVLCALFGSHVAHLHPGWLSRHNLSVEVIRSSVKPQILVYIIDKTHGKKEHFAVPEVQILDLGLFEAVRISARDNAPRFWPLEFDYRIGRRDLGPEECPIFDNPYFCADKRSADPDSPGEYWGGGMVGWVS